MPFVEPFVEPTAEPAPALGPRGSPLSLRGLLAAQSDNTVARLLARRGARLDPNKTLSPREQAARALALLPRAALTGLPASAHEALDALIVAPGHRARRALGGGALALVELGIALTARLAAEPDALVVPAAYRLQLPAPRAESRHAARALLASLDAETRSDIALAVHGRRSNLAWPLLLEEALLRLESAEALDDLLALQDRDALLALSAIEARGGEVALDEYLDLCREPARWSGARIPRRGVAFHLVCHALILPAGDGRLVMPEELAARVGRERRAKLLRQRVRAIKQTAERDDEPHRALLATPRAPRALAAWLMASTPGRATGRAAIARAARAGASSFEQSHLLVSLVEATPLRGHSLRSYDRALLATWRAGRVWDELLETPRVSADATLETPTVVLRACALDALASLPRGRFAPRASVRAAIESDLRFEGVRTAFMRGRLRRDHGWVAELGIALDRMLDVSLPALGLIDVAADSSLRASASFGHDDSAHDEGEGETPSEIVWSEDDRARVVASTSLDLLPALLGTVDAVAELDALLVLLDPTKVDLEARERWLAALARARHPNVTALEARCVQPRGQAVALRSSFVVVLPTPELAQELRAMPELHRWLAEPQPDGAVLVFGEHAPRTTLTRALARAGLAVELPRATRADATVRRRRTGR